MIQGMSVAAFALFHVIISLIGIVSGLIVVIARFSAQRIPALTALFLLTTVATDVTGFMFYFTSFGAPEKRMIDEGASMSFELQPRIENQWIKLEPLAPSDFESLYAVASDPSIWLQHPSKTRYQRDIFALYFKSAIESGGAFRVVDNTTGTLIGSSRYYDFDQSARIVAIGYTFLARNTWGRPFNRALKTLMLDHAFHAVDKVIFHVGMDNIRSRKAMEKLGGVYAGEIAMAYYGEESRPNVIYEIGKSDWARRAVKQLDGTQLDGTEVTE